MRIRLITGAYFPSLKHGGPVVTNHCLAKALQELGHDVSILTTDIDGDARLKLDSYDTQWDGVPVRYCRCSRLPLPYYSSEMYSVMQKQDRPDIILLSSSWTMYGLTVGRFCHKHYLPYIVYGHGSHDPYRMSDGALKKKLFWQLFDSRLYRRADALIALTETEKQHFQKLRANSRIEVIPNGVSLAERDHVDSVDDGSGVEGLLQDKKYILFLGRIAPVKGLDMLIKAFASMDSRLSNLALVLAGPDEDGYLAKIKQMIAESGLNDRVIFTGSVAGNTKRYLLKNAWLFALTSYGEGLPMAVLEAMACSVPVLITHPCNIPEVARCHAGMVVEPQVPEIIAGLNHLLLQADRQQMGENGEKLVAEKFTWQQVARQTQLLCQQILQEKN